MHLAVADENERRDIAAQIEQGVHLHRRLSRSKRRPRKHRQAQIDSGRVQRIDGIIELNRKRLIGIEPTCDTDQVLSEVCIDTPIAYRIGIG